MTSQHKIGRAGIDSANTQRRTLIAACIGNALEWYDFTAYGFFALTIAKTFFPAQSEIVSILLSAATFGVGFVMRPFGSFLLGAYADRAGRRAALSAAMFLMTAGTAIIVVTPGYSQIGLAAPALIVIARVLQGFSVSGELGSATAFLAEAAPPRRRALFVSWQIAGQYGATLLAVALGALVTGLMPSEQLASWGWRLPFVVGLVLGPIGLYMRLRAVDSSEFLAARRTSGRVVAHLIREHTSGLAIVFGLTVLGAVSSYALIVFMPTYAASQLGLSLADSYLAVAIGSLIGLIVSPLYGILGDSIGRGWLIGGATLLVGLLAYPLLHWVQASPTATTLAAVEAILSLLLVAYAVTALAIGAGIFPAGVRAIGLSVGYSLAVALFGGFAPFVSAWLIRTTSDPLAPAFYVGAAALVTLATVIGSWRRPAYGG